MGQRKMISGRYAKTVQLMREAMTKLDQRWAQAVIKDVNALVLEIQRLEEVGERYENALEQIVLKVPEKVSQAEAADMAVEFKQGALAALGRSK